MKKLSIILLMLAATSVNADSSSHSIGRITTYIGTTISISVTSNNGSESVFIYTRGRHKIRKAAASMSKAEAIRLRDLLNKAISDIK